jgi:hypothetical protein
VDQSVHEWKCGVKERKRGQNGFFREERVQCSDIRSTVDTNKLIRASEMQQKTAQEDDIGVKARSVLWYLSFIGFAMNYMIRINVNIAIVDMIAPEFKGNSATSSECFELDNATMLISNATNSLERYGEKYVSLEKRFLDYIGVS